MEDTIGSLKKKFPHSLLQTSTSPQKPLNIPKVEGKSFRKSQPNSKAKLTPTTSTKANDSQHEAQIVSRNLYSRNTLSPTELVVSVKFLDVYVCVIHT